MAKIINNLQPTSPVDDACIASFFHWLLQIDSQVDNKELFESVISKNLLSNIEEEFWEADIELISVLLKNCYSFPNNLKTTTMVLYGLGEVCARSHICPKDHINHLITLLEHSDIFSILDLSTKISHEREPFTWEDIPYGQRVNQKFDWDTLHSSSFDISHYPHHRIFRRDGHGFIIKLLLNIKPKEVIQWLSNNKTKEIKMIMPIIKIHENLAMSSDISLIKYLLSSDIPYIKLLGCYALFREVTPHNNLTLVDVFDYLNNTNIPLPDIAWIVGFYQKEFIHHWYRLNSRIEQTQQRKEFITQYPKCALGNGEYYTQELEQLDGILASDNTCLIDNRSNLNDFFKVFSKGIGKTKLSKIQFNYLNKSFVDSSEHRYLLALEISPRNDLKNLLLQQNIKTVKTLITNDKVNFFSDYNHKLKWAALSLIELNKNNDIGKKAGQLIGSFTPTLITSTSSPYLSITNNQLWKLNIGKLALINQFSILIIEQTDKEKNDLSQLTEHTIKGVYSTLKISKDMWFIYHEKTNLMDSLLHSLIWISWNYRNELKIKPFYEAWGKDESLPNYVRAIAIFSDPESVNINLDTSFTLINQLSEFPLDNELDSQQLNRLLCVLDIAIASAYKFEVLNYLPRIHLFWESTLDIWEGKIPKYLNHASTDLDNALKNRQIGHNLISTDGFKNSYCLNFLNKHIKLGK